ncbi:hypothetical protein LXA43DRAFT_1066826 [Ganoderma leucocontextum]|nr:hypothetical protein LXA43DRAFT_1066826 [Ganoderma leucocontextum]
MSGRKKKTRRTARKGTSAAPQDQDEATREVIGTAATDWLALMDGVPLMAANSAAVANTAIHSPTLQIPVPTGAPKDVRTPASRSPAAGGPSGISSGPGTEVASGTEAASGTEVPPGTEATSGTEAASGTEVPSGTETALSTRVLSGTASGTFPSPPAHPMPVLPYVLDSAVPLFHGSIPDVLPSSSQDRVMSMDCAQDFVEAGTSKDGTVAWEKGYSEKEIAWQKKHGHWDGMQLDQKLLSLGEKVLKEASRRVSFAGQSSRAMDDIMRMATSLHFHLDVASCTRWTDYNTMLVKMGDECSEDMARIFAK